MKTITSSASDSRKALPKLGLALFISALLFICFYFANRIISHNSYVAVSPNGEKAAILSTQVVRGRFSMPPEPPRTKSECYKLQINDQKTSHILYDADWRDISRDRQGNADNYDMLWNTSSTLLLLRVENDLTCIAGDKRGEIFRAEPFGESVLSFNWNHDNQIIILKYIWSSEDKEPLKVYQCAGDGSRRLLTSLASDDITRFARTSGRHVDILSPNAARFAYVHNSHLVIYDIQNNSIKSPEIGAGDADALQWIDDDRLLVVDRKNSKIWIYYKIADTIQDVSGSISIDGIGDFESKNWFDPLRK